MLQWITRSVQRSVKRVKSSDFTNNTKTSTTLLQPSHRSSSTPPYRGILTLKPLPYFPNENLQPAFSRLAVRRHYWGHMDRMVKKTNELTYGTQWYIAGLEQIVHESSIEANYQVLHNNASGLWNHYFFFQGIQPGGSTMPPDLLKLIELQFGSWEEFKTKVKRFARALFGGGWIWLVDDNGQLDILTTFGENSPLLLSETHTILLGLDMWEHAYYRDHLDDTDGYVDAFFEVVNWDEVISRMAAGRPPYRPERIPWL